MTLLALATSPPIPDTEEHQGQGDNYQAHTLEDGLNRIDLDCDKVAYQVVNGVPEQGGDNFEEEEACIAHARQASADRDK